MSETLCERWARIVDRAAIGESLSEEESRFVGEHEATCADCAAESAVYRELRAAVEAGAEEAGDASARVDRVLSKLQPREPIDLASRAARLRRTRVLAWGGIGAIAAAASIAIVVWSGRTPRATAPATQEPARVTIASGNVDVDGTEESAGTRLEAGARLRAGRGNPCLRVEPGVRACLATGSRVRIADTRRSDRRLHLAKGRLVASLDSQPAGTSFSVSTRSGTVTAVGTVFSVEVGSDGGPVVVRVIEGRVEVRSADSRVRRLDAGRSLVLGEATPTALSPDDERADLTILGEAPVPPEASPSSPVAAQPREPAPDGGLRTVPGVVGRPPGELLREARSLRAQGRFLEAARVYERLQRVHPQSAEAQASRVSLGHLRLSKLGDARGALRSFDAYLARPGGSLTPEAKLGRIRALGALGRRAEERGAIEAFLAEHPNSVQSRSLRERLRAVESE